MKTTSITMQMHATNYLKERRSLGFALRSPGYSINSFARYVDALKQQEPITIEIMSDWAKLDKFNSNNPKTWAKRLKVLRSFIRYLRQFYPYIEVPDNTIFGRCNQRVAPHIYTDEEIVNLLAAAHQLKPKGLRSATYETLFGLIASTGLRVSEAVHLLNTEVDLKHGILTIRQTKFAKSRYVPLHSSTVKALKKYHSLRNTYIKVNDETSFFVGSKKRNLGDPIKLRQVRRIFSRLRKQLGWINRGAHDAPRIHDLRHTFVVRRVMLWPRLCEN